MNKLKRGVSFITLLALLATWPSLAYGQEISDEGDYELIKKDQKAPYDGYLFDTGGLIKIMINKSLEIEKIKITKDAEIAKINIELDYIKKQHALELKIKDELNDNMLKIRDNRIKLLEDDKKWDNLKLFGALFLGMVLSVTIFYAAVQITNLKTTNP